MLIIKREQQFRIFIYCNVILESFFISNGWFLNKNVEEKAVMLSCYVFDFVSLLRYMRELMVCLYYVGACVCVCMSEWFRGAKIHFSNMLQEKRRKILHLICIKCLCLPCDILLCAKVNLMLRLCQSIK